MAAAPLLIVEHATDLPAEDSMVAGALAGYFQAAGVAEVGFARLRSPGLDFVQLGACEHATAYGSLLSNGMIWAERALGRDLDPDADVTAAEFRPAGPTVLAVNPNLVTGSDRQRVADLATARLGVDAAKTELALILHAAGKSWRTGTCSRDRYGRPILDFTDSAPLLEEFGFAGLHTAPTPAAPPAGGGTEIVVVGEEAYHRETYPALLAALGDAADSLGQAPTVRFLSPRRLSLADWPERLAVADAVLLPGGPDTTQTAGQVDAAAVTLDAGVPTLGICLGMQTMTTAFARRRAGLPGAGMEEIDPGARPQTFMRMRTADGEGMHRVGAKQLNLDPASQLAGLLNTKVATERLHHRYHLSPELAPRLAASGLRISARDSVAAIVDAVEAPEHPFFMGLQCHFELSSRGPQHPHPVLTAFLRAAAACRAQRGALPADTIASALEEKQG